MKKTDDEDSGVFHKMKKNSIPENNQDWNQEMTDQKEKKTYANAAVPPPFLPVALTVAGSDSGGGAGIQADLRTFAALGVFGASAITAATFQNPLEVCGVEALSPKAVAAQIRTVEKVLNISAAKTGMLFSEEIIRSVADALSGCRHEIVSDPVMVSTSGAKLLRDSAVEAVKSKILPLCTWTTPNLPEAEVLTGTRLDTPRKRRDAARRIYETWGCHVILKGGHVAEEDTGTADDIVCYGGDFYLLSSPRVASAPHADHGTGCTFSAAFTACLAAGESWERALCRAKDFVFRSLFHARPIGGKGYEIYAMFPPGESHPEQIRLERL